MKTTETTSNDYHKSTPFYTGVIKRAILLFALIGSGISSVQADLSITALTQTPANNVGVEQIVTYDITVTKSGNASAESPSISVTDNGVDVTAYFFSQQCGYEGRLYCNSVSTVSVFSIYWTPPTEGTHNLVFNVNCSPNCNGDQAGVTTIVGISDLPNQPPIAYAGPDRSVTDTNNDGTELVTLDGSGSTDANNDIVSYEWFESQQSLGTGVTLGVNLTVGTYALVLVVTDQMGNTSNDEVIINVNAPVSNNPPVASAGPDQSVTDSDNDGSEPVTLNGNGSTDPDNDIETYEWLIGEQLLGSGATIQLNLAVGTHTITLAVTDLMGNTSFDNVNITVQENQGEAGIETISGDNQRLSPGEQSNPLSIRALGADGLPLQGTTIIWTVIPADAATLTNSSTTTDSNGESNNTVTPTANRPGSAFRVTASTSGGLSARFLVNPLAGISGLTTAQRSIAGALDNACPALQSLTRVLSSEEQGLLSACDFLAAASDQEIASALQQLLPDEVAAQGRNSLSLARIRNRNILLRLEALRSGQSGPSLEQLSLSIQGEQLPAILISELNRVIRGGGASADDANAYSRLGMFVNGNVSVGDTETTAQEAGFDFKTSGLTMGVDYRFTDQLVFGGALNYLSNDSDYVTNSGSLGLEGYSLSAYGTYYYSEQVFVDGILSLGQNSYDSARNFQAAGTTHHLTADTDGSEQALTLGAGYEVQMQNLTFVPQARINYLRFKIDSYDEASSGSGVNLHIDEQEIESLTTSVSANLSMAYSTSYGVFIPYLSIEWEHEFNNDSRAIVARFVNDPSVSSFSVLSDDPDRDYFNLGLGVTATLTNGKSAFLHYEHLLGYADTAQYTVTGGFRLEF